MPVEDVTAAVTDWTSRYRGYRLYRDYDAGRHRSAFATEAFEKQFRDVLEEARENLCPAVIRAFTDKLNVTGWEGGGAERAEAAAEDLGLPRVSNMARREALRCGDGFVLVWPDGQNKPRPWPHRAEQFAVKPDPDDPAELAWAAKIWVGPRGYGRVNVYYPDRCERWVTVREVRTASERSTASTGDSPVDSLTTDTWPLKPTAWTEYTGDDDDPGGPVITHTFGRVPVVWWAFDPDTIGGHGRSILRDVVPIQDALNKSLADLIVGGESFAQPLRYLLRYQPRQRINPDTGQPETEKLKYDATKNKLLGIPGEGPMGQLDPPDATKLTSVQDAYALKVARVVGIPSYYFTQSSGDVPSGASLRVLSSRLTAGVEDMQQDFGPAESRLLGLLGVEDARPVWDDPAPMDPAEELEMAKTRHDIGYPLRYIARRLGDDLDQLDEDSGAEEQVARSAGQQALAAFRNGQDPASLLSGG